MLCLCACNPLTLPESRIKSSAYMIHPINVLFMEQPLSNSCTLRVNTFTNTLKIAGDKTLPCLTPLPTLKQLERTPFHLTTTYSLLYQLIKSKTMQLGTPALSKDMNNL